MARQSSILTPTSASLPDTFRIPSSTNQLVKTLSKLSRASLISLALQWLEKKNLASCSPYLLSDQSKSQGHDDDTSPYSPAQSVEDLKIIYNDFQGQKGGKREVIDRILEGDWRHGLTLRQLAMADVRHIEEHPSSHRWTAFRVDASSASASSLPSDSRDNEDYATALPHFQASSFIKAMQREISPLVKAHYHIHRFHSLPLTLVRILAIDSPYQFPRQSPHTFIDSSRLIYLAFPDSTPFIYSSLVLTSNSKRDGNNNMYSTDARTLRRIINDAVPKALSRPQQRYSLTSTSLAAKSLHTLLTLRGPWRTPAAIGAFSVFADAVVETGPLEPRISNAVPFKNGNARTTNNNTNKSSFDDKENLGHSPTKRQKRPVNEPRPDSQSLKKRKQAIMSRFGTSGDPNRALPSFNLTPQPLPDQNKTTLSSATDQSLPQITPNPALDRLEIQLQDSPTLEPGSSPHQTVVSLTFSGSDVVAGLRQLAELGVIDPNRMPSWMTGEDGVSSAVIKGGVTVTP
ncbi:CHL4 family chromosome segregation protein, putative [Trichophyton verrucosum HKI 0517]|uniref:CHL4 family chromosome segregation protein, putative n=1 Tax=Trichophyton verrucosum (strain HKI 0517) TaxID=663202 RepID=D4CYZ0_TRIVH|nr:CHL4 family chromosome segregation protein, putative [Trichophyton verrucosum HKI 0517]EFE45154.1 CHL4 family chromosome segregation protein, putative [Trichophyton verrucosum HKI 0517]